MLFKRKKKRRDIDASSIAQKEKMLFQNTIASATIFSIVGFYYGLCVCAYQGRHLTADLPTALSNGIDYLTNPMMLWPFNYDISLAIVIPVLIACVSFIFYFKDKMKVHNDVNTIKGSTEWADKDDIVDRYAEHSDKTIRDYQKYTNNIPLSQNVWISLNMKKHFKALNTLISGTTGSGKSRYFLKPNLLQMNSNYVVTDPKGELLDSCGEMLRRNGYRVRVFDILNMGGCDTYNPLEYCDKESDIKKLVQAFIKNASGKEGGGSQDPFWDDSMNAFLCACIGLLTQKPKGSDKPYGKITEVMGGKCYEAAFAVLCEFTRMANKKWTPGCGVDLLDGVTLGDGKNNTANASQLAAIFENLRQYEANLQDCEPDAIEKPYCLREWENFRIAPEKTSTTILMTTAVKLSAFNIEQVRNLTSSNTIDLRNFGKGRDAMFLIIPPTDRTYNFLVAFLYTQLFDLMYKLGAEGSLGAKLMKLKDGELVRYFPKEEVDSGEYEQIVQAIKNSTVQKVEQTTENGKDDSYYNIIDANGDYVSSRVTKAAADKYVADLQHAKILNGKNPEIPYHCRFLMDEFANIGELPEFKDKLGTVRGYQISITIFLQSITQLKGMYEKDYETIDGNCPFTIFLGGDENTNNEYLSKKMGSATVKSNSVSLDNKDKANKSYGIEERALMKPEELGRIAYEDCILFIYGEQPIKDKKIDYTSLPNYKMTHDYADDIGEPDLMRFHRPHIESDMSSLIYKPILPRVIPHIFDFNEENLKAIFQVSSMPEVTESINDICRNAFDATIDASVAAPF